VSTKHITLVATRRQANMTKDQQFL